MTTGNVPIRVDVPISIHPDVITPHETILNIPQTVGLSAYAAGREALTSVYITYANIVDAKTALNIAASIGHRKPVRMRLPSDGAIGANHAQEAEMAEAAAKAVERTLNLVGRREKEIEAHTQTLQQRVVTALEDPFRKTPEGLLLAVETRSYVKSLAGTVRMKFLKEVIDAGDLRTVSAVLAGRAFISGMSEEEMAVLREIAAISFAKTDHSQLRCVQAIAKTVAASVGQLMSKYAEIEKLRESPRGRANVAIKKLASGGQK